MSRSSQARKSRRTDVLRISQEFGPVKDAVKKWEDDKNRSGKSLGQSLRMLFEFGERNRGDTELLQVFLRSSGLPWNKTTQENPYNGLAALAFGHVKKSSISQYSRVLRLAHDTIPVGSDLVTWLGAGGGVEGRYDEAVARYRASSGGVQDKLNSGLQHLRENPISEVVKFIGPDVIEGEFATALVRNGGNGPVIVAILERDQMKLEPIIRSFGSRSVSLESLTSIFGLLTYGVQLVQELTRGKTATHGSLVITNSTKDGRTCCKVSATSADYTFPWAAATLPAALPGLPVGKRFLLSAPDAERLVSNSSKASTWSIDRAEDFYHLKSESLRLDLRPHRDDQPPILRTAVLRTARTKRFTLTVSVMKDLLESLEKLAKWKRSRSLFPRATRLDLTLSGRSLEVRPRGLQKWIALPFLKFKTSQSVAPNRWFSIADIRALCTTLTKYNLSADGWFMDFEVADSGIVVTTEAAGNLCLEIIVPLVVTPNQRIEYAQTCEDLAADVSLL